MSYIIPAFISYAGCPHRCAFCNQHSINGERGFSLAGVKEQIEKYLAFLPGESDKELAFYGGSFTGLPDEEQEQLLGLANEYRENKKISRMRMSTRPDYIDETVLKRLSRYKVHMVELGVQSLDDKVLERAGRGHDASTVELAAALLRRGGITVGLQLMVGLPGQDWASIKQTTARVVKIAPAVVRIYPLLVFEHTQFADEWRAGVFQPLSLPEAVEQTAYMAESFEQAGIKVIRLGLQEDDGLKTEGAILAGPHHPAFGELVASHRYKMWLVDNLAAFDRPQAVTVLVPAREVSKVYGQKKSNVNYLTENYPQHKISFQVADVEKVMLEAVKQRS